MLKSLIKKKKCMLSGSCTLPKVPEYCSNCVCWSQSLTGHTTSIEAVRFGHAEEMVIAGSLSGALKVWDLEQAKSKLTV